MPDTPRCTQHPNAPTFDGICGGCTQYPADIRPLQTGPVSLLGIGAPTTGGPEACAPGPCTHLLGPCPGDCVNVLDSATIATEDDVVTTTINVDLTAWAKAIAGIRPRPPRHPDKERRDRYAAAIRDHLKAFTLPPLTPGGPPAFGETEWDMADVVLAERDTDIEQLGEELDAAAASIAERTVQENRLRAELAQARAERDAAVRLAEVWTDAPDPLVRHGAADLLSAIRGARPPATEATDPTMCGVTGSGFFSQHLGPCMKAPSHVSRWHRGASGAEWADHTTEAAPGPDPCSGCRMVPCTACHTTPAPRLLDCGLCYEENGEECHPHPECPHGGSVHTVAHAIARALHRFDTEQSLSHGESPSGHHYREADAVLTALQEHLDIGEAEAWCKACLRVWDGRTHRCDHVPGLQQARAERDQLQRAVDGLRRLNELTADGSCRVHARDHAHDNLALLNGILGEPVIVPATSKASSAREDLLNLMGEWGLTTGRGSREHADRILNRRAHEAAEDLRAWATSGDPRACAGDYDDVDNVLEGADRIDPHSDHYTPRQR